MEHERHCMVAPDKHIYQYCPNCAKFNTKEKWRMLYCSQNCYDIYKTYDQFKAGKITATEAASSLKKLDMPSMDDISPAMRPVVEKIFAEGTVMAFANKKRNKREEAPVEFEEQPIEVVNEITEEEI